jgi:hypothetical protein
MLEIVMTAEVPAPAEDILRIEIERKSMGIESLDCEAKHGARCRIHNTHAIHRTHSMKQLLSECVFVRVPISPLRANSLEPR